MPTDEVWLWGKTSLQRHSYEVMCLIIFGTRAGSKHRLDCTLCAAKCCLDWGFHWCPVRLCVHTRFTLVKCGIFRPVQEGSYECAITRSYTNCPFKAGLVTSGCSGPHPSTLECLKGWKSCPILWCSVHVQCKISVSFHVKIFHSFENVTSWSNVI